MSNIHTVGLLVGIALGRLVIIGRDVGDPLLGLAVGV